MADVSPGVSEKHLGKHAHGRFAPTPTPTPPPLHQPPPPPPPPPHPHPHPPNITTPNTPTPPPPKSLPAAHNMLIVLFIQLRSSSGSRACLAARPLVVKLGRWVAQ